MEEILGLSWERGGLRQARFILGCEVESPSDGDTVPQDSRGRRARSVSRETCNVSDVSGVASLVKAQVFLLKDSYKKFLFRPHFLLKIYYIELLCIAYSFQDFIIKEYNKYIKKIINKNNFALRA